MKISSTKKFVNMACAHSQFFDKEEDGSPGECAAFHGYDRSVELTFTGEVDENGWIVPFGELKAVKAFLEYYYDHTSVLGANDPRLPLPKELTQQGGLLATLRVLPYGVSMEMSSLFIWEHVNPYIYSVTEGRCHVSKVESREHERNAAFIEIDETIAQSQAKHYTGDLLPMKPVWDFEFPKQAMFRLLN